MIYIGNGQYYDPTTGRFLPRGSNPNSPNPYLPFDPTGALFLPLALVSLLYGRKRKKSKWDILVIVTLLSLSAAGVIAYYVMDGNRPLTATTGADTNAWSYGLTDGTNPSITLRAGTQRQLTDATGEVTYAARYTPWGKVCCLWTSG